jgi:arylsulfatase A-like enzyme
MVANRQNIVLIMTDQQRFDTIRAWGYDQMITPNLDGLVQRGISFKQAHCPGATCIASRAAIFTGMYGHNTGVFTFDEWAHHRNWVQDLADAGYWCVNIGKMHFKPVDAPGGFHERVIVENPTTMAHAHGGKDDDWGFHLKRNGYERPLDRHKSDPAWRDKLQAVPWHLEERYHSDVFVGDTAVGWIRDYRGDQPFFLQVGFVGAHEPYDPLPRHLDQYQNAEIPMPVSRPGELDNNPPQHRAILEHHANTDHESCIDLRDASESQIREMRRAYYAKVTTIDEQIGNIVNALEDRGLLEDSIIIFCSDHGDMLGDHGMAYKWLMYDTITHIPLIICPAGQTSEAREIDRLVSLIDLGPTILDLVGITPPTYLEGFSLVPLMKGTSDIPRQYVYSEDNYLTMIRSQTHKLVLYTGQEDIGELYDLREDPDELWNRWDDPRYEDVQFSLIQALSRWLLRSNYHTAGYKQGHAQYQRRWPAEAYHNLHDIPADIRPKNLG